jgi:hypothetical protein
VSNLSVEDKEFVMKAQTGGIAGTGVVTDHIGWASKTLPACRNIGARQRLRT